MADPPFQKACDPERMREVGSAWCPAQECGCWPKNWQQWGRAPAAGEINRWWTKPSSSRLSTNNQKQQTNKQTNNSVKATGGGQSPPVVVFRQTTKSNKQTMETNNSVKATGGGQCPVHWAKPLSRTVVFQRKQTYAALQKELTCACSSS